MLPIFCGACMLAALLMLAGIAYWYGQSDPVTVHRRAAEIDAQRRSGSLV